MLRRPKRTSSCVWHEASPRTGVVPEEGDEILVCFIHTNDSMVWYKAGVSNVDHTINHADALCSAIVLYAETEHYPEQEEEVLFYPGMMLRRKDYVGTADEGMSKWKRPRRRKSASTQQSVPPASSGANEDGFDTSRAPSAAPSSSAHPQLKATSKKRKTQNPKRRTKSGVARIPASTTKYKSTPGTAIVKHSLSGAIDSVAATAAIISSSCIERSAGHRDSRDGGRMHGSPDQRVLHTRTLHERIDNFEAELRVLRRRQITDFELRVLNEIRVDTKLGVIAALQRKITLLQIADDAPPHEAVLQPGCLQWSYNVMMDRFQLLLVAIHKHFHLNPGTASPLSVTFSPSFQLMDTETGFSSANVHFRSVIDFFSFLGVRNTSTIAKLMWTPFEARGASHLRVLGGVQTDKTGDTQSLNMTIGYSCLEEAVSHGSDAENVPEPAKLPCREAHAVHNLPHTSELINTAARTSTIPPAHRDSGVTACSFRIQNASWDSENGRFANDPQLVKIKSGLHAAHSCGDASFSIRWTSETPRTQRQLHPDAVDREGVRRGTMVVQLPYYIVGPQLSSQLSEACELEKLHSIITDAL